MIALAPLRRPVASTALAAALLTLAACSNHSSSVRLPSLSDVYLAPQAIQTAARAVVRIGTIGELATGSFISPTGILLTNNHVLGVGICPVEGCFAQLTFMDQLHSDPPPSTQTVFVVPLAVDIGLDMAVVQTYAMDQTTPLDTPNYLTLDSRDPASLLGTHVNIVGHPDGHLKKWSQGEVIDTTGEWIYFSAFALPGNSGSPVLDDAGHMVGILHRGPTEQDLETATGVDEYAIGTASSALIAAMNAPLPGAIWSIRTNATDDDVVAHEDVYLNAHQALAQVDGVAKPVLDSLGAACDAALLVQDYASPDDLQAALEPCYDAEAWIACAPSASTGVPSATTYPTCPTDTAAWAQRYQGAFNRIEALNGQLSLDLVSYAQAALASSTAVGQATASQMLQSALQAANPQPPLDFSIASYLAEFSVLTYQGASVVDFVRNYSKVPDYGLNGAEIANALLWLVSAQAVDRADALAILQSLAADPNVDLGAKLYIEEIRYQSQAIQ